MYTFILIIFSIKNRQTWKTRGTSRSNRCAQGRMQIEMEQAKG